ncbi:MAG: hypothetical protein HQ547_04475 [Candidatus Omnitrophica bacterium]|nr:hypothetical protein [Candidatus Omnitrophota bacterium]
MVAEQLQMAFLPYAPLKEELRIGDIILWPFYQKRTEYLKNQAIDAHIKQFLKQYVNHSKKREPLENITIVSYGSPDNFNPPSQEVAEEIRDAVKILFFATVIRNNSWRAFASNDFQLVYQHFRLGDDGIAPSSGSFIRRTYGGPRIDDILFIKPFNIASGYDIDYDGKILKALATLPKKTHDKLHRRIMRSLEWVMYAYNNSDGFSFDSRIIMMSTAFEILLDGFDGRWDFVNKVSRLICTYYDRAEKNRETRRVTINKSIIDKELSYKEWWAYEFYVLRNDLVHGKSIDDKRYKNRKDKDYFTLSVRFFEICLKKTLGNHYDYDMGERIKTSNIYDEV